MLTRGRGDRPAVSSADVAAAAAAASAAAAAALAESGGRERSSSTSTTTTTTTTATTTATGTMRPPATVPNAPQAAVSRSRMAERLSTIRALTRRRWPYPAAGAEVAIITPLESSSSSPYSSSSSKSSSPKSFSTATAAQTWCQRLYARQLGIRSREPPGASLRRIYGSMRSADDVFSGNDHNPHGGIFNLSFSDDGRMLVAATERRRILMLDPLSHKLVHTVSEAHRDCVNYVRFLDSRVVASCSDDTKVKLWDVRNLREHVSELSGHSGWVKNIEYSSKDGLLVTSGFDGNICKWHINQLDRPYNAADNCVLYQPGLMRMRLTPDETKMVLCTTQGYIMVVHDLDLNTLNEDLKTFRPDMFRMHQRQQITGSTSMGDCERFFNASRNRVELISDFPTDDNAEVISSLQVHPYGWSVLSRNSTYEDRGEWTCVHDIQGLNRSQAGDFGDATEQNRCRQLEPSEVSRLPEAVLRRHNLERHGTEVFIRTGNDADNAPDGDVEENDNNGDGDDDDDDYYNDPNNFGRMRFRLQNRLRRNQMQRRLEHAQRMILSGISRSGASNHANQANNNNNGGGGGDGSNNNRRRRRSNNNNNGDSNGNAPPIELGRAYGEHVQLIDSAEQLNSSDSEDGNNLLGVRVFEVTTYGGEARVLVHDPRRDHDISDGTDFIGHNNHNREYQASHSGQLFGWAINSPAAKQNKPRLMYYLDEPNVGRGFIKELCFSPDGRVICSPYHYGIRLFTFDEYCSELADCVPRRPCRLTEISRTLCHKNFVVSSKFSPTQHLLVSGCLSGRINFHQPRF